jgi:hypothetical protein
LTLRGGALYLGSIESAAGPAMNRRRCCIPSVVALPALVLVALGLALGGAVVPHAWAQPADKWPARAIRILIGYAPGTSIDINGRFLAQRLSEEYGQPVLVDNRPGATGAIAAEAVAKAAPDGFTLLAGPGSGIVAIAAMRAGAANVLAADIDVFCEAAISLNAATEKTDFHSRLDALQAKNNLSADQQTEMDALKVSIVTSLNDIDMFTDAIHTNSYKAYTERVYNNTLYTIACEFKYSNDRERLINSTKSLMRYYTAIQTE